jgi:hypothetical protein
MSDEASGNSQNGDSATENNHGKRAIYQRKSMGMTELNNLVLARLSKHFILRDFMYSSEASWRGLPNLPSDPEMVIRAGTALCETVLEPLTEQFGRPAITYGYASKEAIEVGMSQLERESDPPSSSPHCWDRKSWGDQYYARIDILPLCVEDGLVSKRDYGRWIMNHLDIDLLMCWEKSNVFCVTINEAAPRRVWLEWTATGQGDNGSNRKMLMGTDYWQRIFPTLPESERPQFHPSATNGAMQWRKKS